jgi:hypothetical protein
VIRLLVHVVVVVVGLPDVGEYFLLIGIEHVRQWMGDDARTLVGIIGKPADSRLVK